MARADPDELEHLIERFRPKFLYTNPTFHNLTGGVRSLELRREMLRLAARYRLPVVEDEPYRDLHFRKPPPSLLDLDEQGRVIHLGTFSKTLAVGLRLGWLIAPELVIDHLTLVKQRSDLFRPGLSQLVAADLLGRGDYDLHLRRIRAEHERRHDAMTAASERCLPPDVLTWRPVSGGLYLWAHLGRWLDAGMASQAALREGVAIVEGAPFHADGGGRHDLRLCFARATPEGIAVGVDRLARVVQRLAEMTVAPAGRHALVWPFSRRRWRVTPPRAPGRRWAASVELRRFPRR